MKSPREIEMAIKENSDDDRLFYVDWQRSLGIHLVVVLHCVYSVDLVFGESKKNINFKEKKDSLFRYLIQIGIPVFFFLSGMSASFYKSEKYGFFKYFWSKMNRLVFPFIFSIFVFLVPRLYIAQEFD